MNISASSSIRNLSQTKRPVAAQEAPKATSSAAPALASGPSDSADVSFAKPWNDEAATLLANTSEAATKLEGTLGEFEPGEVIVRTKAGFSLQSGVSIQEKFGAKVLDEFDTPGGPFKSSGGDFLHLKLPHGITTEQAIAAMESDPSVEYASPNHRFDLPDAIDGPEAGSPDDLHQRLYGLHNEGQTGGTADADIDAPEAWAIETGKNQAANGPLIAVIDTGIDYNHVDLKDNIWTNPGEIAGDGIDNDGNGVIDDIHGFNALDNNGDPIDFHSHGTHVAGTIGAKGNNGEGVVGVNHDANIMGIRIFGPQGATAAGIIRGIQYASKMGARVANNSWGGGAFNAGIKEAFEQSPTLHMLSAGNNGRDNDTYDRYPGDYNSPNFVRVAATDHNDKLAGFSNYAPTTVELSAPGVNTYSTIPGDKYASKSGTSMATPHVTGAAALIAAAYPGITNEELKARLIDGVDPAPDTAGKTITGGRLNVGNSIQPEVVKAHS